MFSLRLDMFKSNISGAIGLGEAEGVLGCHNPFSFLFLPFSCEFAVSCSTGNNAYCKAQDGGPIWPQDST